MKLLICDVYMHELSLSSVSFTTSPESSIACDVSLSSSKVSWGKKKH